MFSKNFNIHKRKNQIEGEIQYSMEYPVINDNLNSTVILWEIQQSIEYSIFNNKNPFNGIFNIQ